MNKQISIKNYETKYNSDTDVSLGSRFFGHLEQEKCQSKLKYQNEDKTKDSKAVYSLKRLPNRISLVILWPNRDLNNCK